VRANDTPARLGGDEFAVLLDALGDADEAVAMGARLLDALTDPVQLEGHAVTPAGSVGVAVWDGHASAAEVLRDADAAMYAAKRAGKRRVAVFEPHMHRAAVQRLEQEDALRQALDAAALTVMYQPVVALQTGRIVAVEALTHWPRPDGGSWPLERFEALAEEAGLIVPIGLATLETACRQLRAWQAELGVRAPVLVDVALTPRQAQQPQLAAAVGEALERGGLAARHLELILAEGTPLREPVVLDNLRALRERGVRLGLGGFGSGATNLSALRAVQVDTIKIARAHVQDLGRPGAEALLAHAVVRLCQTLDVQLVADGVDAPEQLDALRQLRCSLGQGPLLVPPVAAEAMTGLLAAGPVHAQAGC
jgi:predicted signal transduction protein with EAL and GGDEF domain